MRHSFKILCAFILTGSTFAQNIDVNQFISPINTGANMTLGINTDDLDDFIGATIGVFNSEGLCVGLEIIQNQFFSVAIWGDDTGTPELDGLLPGDIPQFAILLNNDQVIPIAEMNNFSGYVTNSLQVSSSISLAGCTSDSYLEYHTQGYIAEIDDGSCSTTTYSLDITADMFTSDLHTDNNMVIGINVPIVNQFSGGILGAFYDLNGDGELQCIDLIDIPSLNNGADGFFTISLWGDDVLTDEIDGLLDGQIPTFALLTNTNYVLAFEAVPDFDGYTANAFPTFNQINFDLTIYGCMDVSYCNFNADAEEDDGTCEGLPGCIDDHFVEFDADASCELEGACATTWIAAHEQLSADFTDLSTATAIAANAAADLLAQTIESYQLDSANTVFNYEGQISILTADFETMEADYMVQISNLEDSIANYSSPIAIDIVEGWNLIGYTLDEPQDATATFDGIVEYILIVKNNNADVYWPEFGFNGIGDLIPGQGYQIKVTQAIDGFMYPDTNGQRIGLTPSVPQWVLEMPTETHPNDLRTLVKIVNLLGQEVSEDYLLKGSTNIYLYSDGTVEKKLN